MGGDRTELIKTKYGVKVEGKFPAKVQVLEAYQHFRMKYFPFKVLKVSQFYYVLLFIKRMEDFEKQQQKLGS